MYFIYLYVKFRNLLINMKKEVSSFFIFHRFSYLNSPRLFAGVCVAKFSVPNVMFCRLMLGYLLVFTFLPWFCWYQLK